MVLENYRETFQKRTEQRRYKSIVTFIVHFNCTNEFPGTFKYSNYTRQCNNLL